ncbi:MAG: DinB family protein [Bacillaceae bacterium]|nr:DinB family protein [Bacillaceae bacterium]
MIYFFKYNWERRNEWFEWASRIPHEELLRSRTGGMGSILETFFHVVDVEQRWVSRIMQEEITRYDYEDFQSLDSIKAFSDREMIRTGEMIERLQPDEHERVVTYVSPGGNRIPCKVGEVLRHMIAHEIHHMGQVSVWAREIGEEPVSANLIGRDLM